MASIVNLFRRLRNMVSRKKRRTLKVPKRSRATVGPDGSESGKILPSPAQLEKDEMFLACVLATCSEARQREKDRLEYSKNMAIKAIADLMGRIEFFRMAELVLAMALEAVFQLTLMKPKLPLKLHKLIVHAAFKAVIEVKTEPDKQELEERYTLMLGGLLWEAPSTKILDLLVNELRGYTTSVIAAEKQLAASGISSLMSYARGLSALKEALIPLQLAHLCPKEEDLMLEGNYDFEQRTDV